MAEEEVKVEETTAEATEEAKEEKGKKAKKDKKSVNIDTEKIKAGASQGIGKITEFFKADINRGSKVLMGVIAVMALVGMFSTGPICILLELILAIVGVLGAKAIVPEEEVKEDEETEE